MMSPNYLRGFTNGAPSHSFCLSLQMARQIGYRKGLVWLTIEVLFQELRINLNYSDPQDAAELVGNFNQGFQQVTLLQQRATLIQPYSSSEQTLFNLTSVASKTYPTLLQQRANCIQPYSSSEQTVSNLTPVASKPYPNFLLQQRANLIQLYSSSEQTLSNLAPVASKSYPTLLHQRANLI